MPSLTPLYAATAVSTAQVGTSADAPPYLRLAAWGVVAWLVYLWLKR